MSRSGTNARSSVTCLYVLLSTSSRLLSVCMKLHTQLMCFSWATVEFELVLSPGRDTLVSGRERGFCWFLTGVFSCSRDVVSIRGSYVSVSGAHK